MIFAQAAAGISNEPNLVFTIIASAAGGAAITSVVTIWSKFADSKAEHKRWLRQEKLKAYSEFNKLGYEITSLTTDGNLEQALERMSELLLVVAQIRLLSPSQISLQTLRYRAAAHEMLKTAKTNPEGLDEDRQTAVNALDSLMLMMKLDLSIAFHRRSLGQNDTIKNK